jgi:hypothetical protein
LDKTALWRRTGEICKVNKEFASLVGIPLDSFKGSVLSIYELMSEASAVNYWEKYGGISFDVGQKAVLTSCVLKIVVPSDDGHDCGGRGHDGYGTGNGGTGYMGTNDKDASGDDDATDVKKRNDIEGGSVLHRELKCCFSFTIRRDPYGLPLIIAGNFLPVT